MARLSCWMIALFVIFVIRSLQDTDAQVTECVKGTFNFEGSCVDCSQNCYQGLCDVNNGSCLDDCNQGFYGEKCEKNCTNCKYNICDRYQGSCNFGCEPGYYGDLCRDRCPENCINGCLNENRCQGLCKSGYYGDACKTPCRNCVSDSCDSTSGHCTEGCKQGYHGNKCNDRCSVNCRDQACGRRTGACLEGCNDGFYGQTCTELCNPNCKSSSCEQDGGLCLEGCKTGWKKPNCSVCLHGWYGEDCGKKCNVNCRNGCMSKTGECVNGCSIPGVQPPLCDKVCTRGSYGINCTSPCSPNCFDGIQCHPVNGTCLKGCKQGFKGHNCESVDVADDEDEDTTIIVAVVVGILLVILIIVTVIVLVQRKRKQQDEQIKNTDSEKENHKERSSMDTNEVFLKDIGNDTAKNTDGQVIAGNGGETLSEHGTGDSFYQNFHQFYFLFAREGFKITDLFCTRKHMLMEELLRCSPFFPVGFIWLYLQGLIDAQISGTCIRDEDFCPRYKKTECAKLNFRNRCQKYCGICPERCEDWYVDCPSIDCKEYDVYCRKHCGVCTVSQKTTPSSTGQFNPTTPRNTVCKVGRYRYTDVGGTRCKKCPSTCSRKGCESNGQCVSCEKGYFGAECRHTCGNCISDTCDRDDGACPGGCRVGYHGRDCRKRCATGCRDSSCKQEDGACINSCNAGYFGEECVDKCGHCLGGGCNRSTGTCPRCDVGWDGPMCLNCQQGWYKNQSISNCVECPQRCLGNVCNENGVCDGCQRGFYGRKCDSQCNTCRVFCNQQDGACTEGCIEGMFGKYCRNYCSERCFGRVCDQENGLCNQGCLKGYYGEACNHTCGRCADGECDRNNGKCRGCMLGWKGEKCDACDHGYWGETCENNCSTTCANHSCTRSGICTDGCKAGWEGPKCEKVCREGRHGLHCNQTCSRYCSGGCKPDNGHCRDGCNIPGIQPPTCDQECHLGTFGENCNDTCSDNCLEGAADCNLVNGTCAGGCKTGYGGHNCKTSFVGAFKEDESETGVIAGSVGAVIALVLLATFLLIYLFRISKRRRNTRDRDSSKSREPDVESIKARNMTYSNIESVNNIPLGHVNNVYDVALEENVYYNACSVCKDIRIVDMPEIIRVMGINDNKEFVEEFNKIPNGEEHLCVVGKYPENIPKNRFKTTFPYDHSRVVLNVDEHHKSDYINANFIKDTKGRRSYIASQGPKSNTVADFWRMIVQENVSQIVMLTNLKEGLKTKCEQYWPENEECRKFSNLVITSKSVNTYAYYIVRRLTLTTKETSRTVVQFHYTHWPDHGTPDPLHLNVFQSHVMRTNSSTDKPILVHCSAGIGRTGTFIALDALIRSGKQSGSVNVVEYVKAMRGDRMSMIQNVGQYVFLYKALNHGLQENISPVKRTDFISSYAEVSKESGDINNNIMYEEFQRLGNIKPSYEADDYTTGQDHMEMNYVKTVLPVNKYAVCPSSFVPGRANYYNAVSISFPVEGAAVDLIRLLVDQDTTLLVSIHPIRSIEEISSWVDMTNERIQEPPFEIEKETQCSISKTVRKTTLKIWKTDTNSEPHRVEVYEFLTWDLNELLPSDHIVLVDMVTQIQLDREKTSDGKVLILSRDGVTGCGMFCAVYNAIQQLQQDDEVDMFTVVRQLQIRRPEMISSLQEFKFCIGAVEEYLNRDNVYANT
ncbi:multiple epidermal growth factor-like domains protein 6 [Ostrea edulis]|uniref:multiple epidermal growth factor-like domains protein 6 n=1 Tax=Ostrea edulis TaxID=37623 RepID=UPI0024AFDB17|nr:multiple epidermal growth factor-like domains protein 6 [Ostrea edulis]